MVSFKYNYHNTGINSSLTYILKVKIKSKLKTGVNNHESNKKNWNL